MNNFILKLVTPNGRINSNAVRKYRDDPRLYHLKLDFFWCETIKEIYYCFQNNISQQPKCLICGNGCNFFNGSYKQYCGYGCSNKALAKDRITKGRETKKRIYGDENYNNCEKAHQTNLIKYGHKNPQQNKDVRKRTLETLIKKYGTSCILNSDYGKAKSRETAIKKRGVSHHSKLDSYKKILISRNISRTNNSKNTSDINTINELLLNDKRSSLLSLIQTTNISYKRSIWLVKKFKIIDPNESTRNKHFLYDDNNRSLLENKYKTKTSYELADEYQLSPAHIQRILIHHKIKARVACNQSSQERELIQFLQDNNIQNIIDNDREQINPYELDIFLPEYNVAIEYHGDYFHTQVESKISYKHYKKYTLCSEKHIKLLQIRGSDWKYKKDIWKSIILINLNKCQQRIFARKCKIIEVSHKESKKFLEMNHLQGSCKSSVNLGLIYNNELVMVQTYGSSRFKKEHEELLRMCSLQNTIVIGGASKLFQYYLKKYNKLPIQTFADLEYSNGEIYNKLGFTFKKITNPNYHYYDGDRYINRMNFQKKKFNIPENITEKQYFLDLGYRIYWDTGQKVFEYV